MTLESKMSFNQFARSGQASDPDGVDFDELEEAVGSGAWTVVDVREPHEFAVGHIPNALNLPLSTSTRRNCRRASRWFLYCQAGGRSKNALNRARATGRDDVRHYAGGMNGWRMHGGDVTLEARGSEFPRLAGDVGLPHGAIIAHHHERE